MDEKRFLKTVTKELNQNIIMENRKKMSISGVVDVESFDEDNISLYTEAGMLNIRGEKMRINKLSVESGDVTVEGEINSLAYTDEEHSAKGGSIFKKLFK